MSKDKKKTAVRCLSLSRREFLKISGNAAFLIGVDGVLRRSILLGNGMVAVPASEGYLLVDTKKCQGCLTCMLACSLCHEGKENLSLSRIQILQNPFEGYPDDLDISQCRQCVDPLCVKACPAEALIVDRKHGNIRRIDETKCIGCESCIEACPFIPSRSSWDGDKEHALKCDLCLDTPYWEQKGGLEGKQACVELCPLGALMFTDKVPDQQGSKGYNINLRGRGWKKLGFSIDD
jgi:protein NrfC